MCFNTRSMRKAKAFFFFKLKYKKKIIEFLRTIDKTIHFKRGKL